MSYEQMAAVGMLVLLFAVLSVFATRGILDSPSRVICILLIVTTLNEFVAFYCAKQFQNSNIVYAIFSPIEIFIIGLYFNYSIDSFSTKNIGIWIGVVGCILGFVDLWIQTPSRMNNFFLLTESIIVVSMCMYAFYRMLLNDDDLNLVRYPHFWFTAIFLFFWTSTFLFWGLYEFMTNEVKRNGQMVHTGLLIINAITYIGFGLVFLNYKKMKSAL